MTDEDRKGFADLILKELVLGALEIVEDPESVLLITPAFVVRSAAGKYRLVHDLRALNARLEDASARYDRVRDALALGGAVATKIDIASAFKHIPVHADLANCMCFAVDGLVLRWRRLPFGCSWSPSWFSQALQPAVDELRSRGLSLVVYVDDIYVSARSVPELDEAVVQTILTLQRRGWKVAPDKVHAFAYSKCPFLGLVVDLDDRCLRVAPSKAAKLERLCADALARERVTTDMLHRIVGLLSFFLEAVPTVGLFWRALRGALTDAERHPGRHVWVRGALQCELTFWARQARALPSWTRAPVDGAASYTIVTDASDSGTGALWWPPGATVPDVEQWAADRLRPAVAGADVAAWELASTDTERGSGVREFIGGANGLLAVAAGFFEAAGQGAWFRDVLRLIRVEPGAGLTCHVALDVISEWQDALAAACRVESGTLGAHGAAQPPLPSRPQGVDGPPQQRAANTPGGRSGPVSAAGQSQRSTREFPSVVSRSVDAPGAVRAGTGSLDGTAASSTSRRAVLDRVLAGLASRPPIGTIRWICDSQCASAALLRWRSGAEGMAAMLVVLALLSRLFGAVVQPIWVARDLGWLPAADWLSREAGRRRQAEWSLGRDTCADLCRRMLQRESPAQDVFATARNSLAPRFLSQFPELGSGGNAWDVAWEPDAWVFPPFQQADRAVTRWLEGARHRAIFVLHSASPALRRLQEAGAVVRERRLPRTVPLYDVHGVAAPAAGRPPLTAVCVVRRQRPAPTQRGSSTR